MKFATINAQTVIMSEEEEMLQACKNGQMDIVKNMVDRGVQKTEEYYEFELEQIENLFPCAKFRIAIPLEEMDDVITEKTKIKIKYEYNCYCHRDSPKKTTYIKIQGDKITNRYVLEELIKKNFNIKCNHNFVEEIYVSSEIDCDFELWTGS